jgi:hypothetical protein
MAKKGDFREQVIGFLQTALRELHQAAMYAQGMTQADVRRLVSATETLKARITEEMSTDLVQDREEAKKKSALMQTRKEAAIANRMKFKKK